MGCRSSESAFFMCNISFFFKEEEREMSGFELRDKVEGALMNLKSMVRLVCESQEWDGPELSAILDDVLEATEKRLKEAFMELVTE